MKRILVVDDEQDICEILRLIWKTPVTVVSANSAEQALELL